MLSVWRKPVEIYIGSTIVLIRDGNTCTQYARVVTQPLGPALDMLSDEIRRLNLGFCRRAQVSLSAALWPATQDENGSTQVSRLMLDTIEQWLLKLGILTSTLSPLWSEATTLASVQSTQTQVLILIEPDSKICVVQTPDERIRQQTFEPNKGDDQILIAMDDSFHGKLDSILKLKFSLQTSPQGLRAHSWDRHWSLV